MLRNAGKQLLRSTRIAVPRIAPPRIASFSHQLQPLSSSSVRSFHRSVARLNSQYSTGSLSDQDYAKVSESTMDSLTEYLESHLESLPHLDPSSIDIEYSASQCRKSGVLTVKLGEGKGTYVINKQPPNKQIWLSSPLSGPKRYDFDPKEKVWFYARDGSTMHGLLNEELRGLLGDETFDVQLETE
ncbi:ferroxidase [Sporobolomyces salmoneus]|uniref:ferroxidase n=1 Tax=Sporobolomyces salmoneus TaxID=183962 RepID=UPI00316EDE85